MASVTKSVDVNVPVRTAYDQWTQFESFPQFMEGVEEVRQQGDKRLHWRAKIGGKTQEWDADITEQHPDHRVAWRSTMGDTNSGVVEASDFIPEEHRNGTPATYGPGEEPRPRDGEPTAAAHGELL